MLLRILPLLCALLPFLAVHLTYLTAAAQGSVPWCIPYIDSCTSISATGREPPASGLFRALMLPSAVLIMGYWLQNHAYLLAQRAAGADLSRRTANTMLLMGVVAAIGLVIYVSVLGEVGRAYQYQRRVGTVLFFSLTFLAQLLFAAQLLRVTYQLPPLSRRAPRWMLHNCWLLLLLGVLTVVLEAVDGAFYDTVEDAFEWVLALLLQLNFLLGWYFWRQQPWRLLLLREDAQRVPASARSAESSRP